MTRHSVHMYIYFYFYLFTFPMTEVIFNIFNIAGFYLATTLDLVFALIAQNSEPQSNVRRANILCLH